MSTDNWNFQILGEVCQYGWLNCDSLLDGATVAQLHYIGSSLDPLKSNVHVRSWGFCCALATVDTVTVKVVTPVLRLHLQNVHVTTAWNTCCSSKHTCLPSLWHSVSYIVWLQPSSSFYLSWLLPVHFALSYHITFSPLPFFPLPFRLPQGTNSAEKST